MRRTSSLSKPVIALFLLSTSATGQAVEHGSPPVAPGRRIRVATDSQPRAVSGAMMSYRSDTLVYRPDRGGGLIAVPLASIRRLEVSGGTRTNRKRATTLGFAAGALVGGTIGLSMYDKPTCSGGISCVNVGPMEALFGAVAGGAAGALVGYVVGARPREIWNHVPPCRGCDP
jgi:hypothetical protein